jgi:hypothetical protein
VQAQLWAPDVCLMRELCTSVGELPLPFDLPTKIKVHAFCTTVFLAAQTLYLPEFAISQNKMPPAAPSFQRGLEESETAVPTTYVTPRRPPQSEPVTARPAPQTAQMPVSAPTATPLQANVSKFDANSMAGQSTFGTPRTLSGYMTVTEPGPSGSRNVPGEAFRQWLQTTHPQFALQASKLSSTDIVDVTGHWDDAAKTLAKLGIPCTKIGMNEFRDYHMDRAKVLIINCAGFMNRDCQQRVRDFVTRGGYLLTTDWALDNVLQGAFPGYLAYNRKRNRDLAYVAEVRDPDPILFRNTVSSANWKCEMSCHLVTVQKPQAVRVLVRSRKLAGEDGEGVLAATFQFGRGYVLHLVGHFDNNQGMFRGGDALPDPAPVINIALRQAIATNFVVAGVEGRPVQVKGLGAEPAPPPLTR